ncbi:MAG: ATP-binding cassette domain-containing protein [Mycoplasmatales bacterium]
MVKISNITKSYEKNIIFDNVSFQFNSKINYIVGDNGTGKTTLLNMIAGVDKDYEGNIDTSNINNIVYLSQDNQLIEELSFSKNIEIICPNYSNEKLKFLLENFSMQKKYKSKTKVEKFSGGEKKKVHIIIGLLKEFDLLILDEVDNHLDIDSLNFLVKYIINLDKYVIISSHTLDQYMSKDDYSIYQISKNGISKIKETNHQIIESNSSKGKNILTPKALKYLLSTVSYVRYFLAIFIILLGLFVSNLTLESLRVLISQTESYDTSLKFSENSSIVYAPAFSSSFTTIPHKEYLNKTKLFFTSSDLNKLKDLKEVKNVIPIRRNYTYIGTDIYNKNGIDYTLDLPSINDKSYMFEYIDTKKEVLDNVPYSYFFRFHNLLYGSIPNDNSNQILVDESVANYLIKENNINSLDELIGKTVNLPVINTNNDKSSLDFQVAGIYESIGSSQNLIYVSLNNDSNFYSDALNMAVPDNEHTKFELQYYVSEILNTNAYDYKNYLQKDESYYYGFYVELENGTSMKDFTKKISGYDQYIHIYNNYSIKHYPIFVFLKLSIIKVTILVLLLIIMFLIINALCLKYYYNKIIHIINKLKFHNIDNQSINKYIKGLKIRFNLTFLLALIISFVGVMYFSSFVYTNIYIILMIVYIFTFIISLFINKMIYINKEKHE